MSDWPVWFLIGFAPLIGAVALGLRALIRRTPEAWSDRTIGSEALGWLAPAMAVLAVLPLGDVGLSPVRLALVCAVPMLAFEAVDYLFAFAEYHCRLKDRKWTGKLIWTAVCGWVQSMIVPAAVAVFLLGSALFGGERFAIEPRVWLFVAFLIASWIGHGLSSMLGSRSMYVPGDLRLLAPCELGSRASEIAGELGIRINEVRIFTEVPYHWAGGCAYGPGSFALTEDLVTKLTKPEVDAIVAHEVGHITNASYWWLYAPVVLLAWLAWIAAAVFVERQIATLPATFHSLRYVLWVCLFVGPRLAWVTYSRWGERRANRHVSALANPRAVISGFYKLTLINEIPHHASRWARLLCTHPTVLEEIERVAREHGISDEDVRRIMAEARSELADDAGDRYELAFHQPAERELMQRPSKRRFNAALWIACAVSVVAIFGAIAATDVLYAGQSSTLSMVVALALASALAAIFAAIAWRKRSAAYRDLRMRMREKLELLYPEADESMLLVDAVLMTGWDEQIWQGALIGVRDGQLLVLGELDEARVSVESVITVVRYDAQRSSDDLLGELHPVAVWYEVDGVSQWLAVANLGRPGKGFPRSPRQLEAHIRAMLIEAGAQLEPAVCSGGAAGYLKRGILALLMFSGICALLHAVLQWFGMRDSWVSFGLVALTVGQWLWQWVVGFDGKHARPRRPSGILPGMQYNGTIYVTGGSFSSERKLWQLHTGQG